ncbi:thiamine diphosphokinase [Pectinatus frisingensis]|jgi:thiamine pyrophosphokinase|uniref:thiamine diphosphokinase n=1 Tax=Pectinatus frisingensis TaxID=865 RepID=UPI0015F48638|nr:thiamine diphosphokinase [Pectinatus frisingensis]
MIYKLSLPEILVSYETSSATTNKLLLISGGRAPESAWLQSVSRQRIIYCADHGIDICRHSGVMPDYILGDGDSAAADNWQWAKKSNIPLAEYPVDKNLTDTQLVLQVIAEKYHQNDIVITGAWGGRFDHLYSSIFSSASLAAQNNIICAADEKETLLYLQNGTLQVKCHSMPISISLLPLSTVCEAVSINGVKWPLHKVVLQQYWPYAISNVLQKDSVLEVTVGKGLLGIYFCWSV